jgi:hypothetical protein
MDLIHLTMLVVCKSKGYFDPHVMYSNHEYHFDELNFSTQALGYFQTKLFTFEYFARCVFSNTEFSYTTL